MGWAPLNLGTSSDVARDVLVASPLHVNCHAEQLSPEAKHKAPLYAHVGFEQWAVTAATIGEGWGGDCRGMFAVESASDTYLIALFGINIKQFDANGVDFSTGVGLGATVEQVTFARNRNDPIDGYLCGDTGLTDTNTNHIKLIDGDTISAPSFDAAIKAGRFNSVCSMDGYFIFTKWDGEFYISGIDSPTVDPLDFAKCQNSWDGLLRGIPRGDDLCLFGSRSVEFWDNTGNTDFPFERRAAKNFGIYRAATAVSVMAPIGQNIVETVVFAVSGPDGVYKGICLLNGYEVVKISTWQVDADVLAEANPESLRGYTYTHQGITFYVITGRTFTWQCNLARGTWSKRKSYGLDRWKIHDAVEFDGKTLFGRYVRNSSNLGVIYQASGSAIPSAASQLSMRHSSDGGENWSTARTKAIGNDGERDQRLIYQRLGQARGNGHLIELTVTNAIREGEDNADMVVQAPLVHGYPNRIAINALAVDVLPGTSSTAMQKGIAGAATDFGMDQP